MNFTDSSHKILLFYDIVINHEVMSDDASQIEQCHKAGPFNVLTEERGIKNQLEGVVQFKKRMSHYGRHPLAITN